METDVAQRDHLPNSGHMWGTNTPHDLIHLQENITKAKRMPIIWMLLVSLHIHIQWLIPSMDLKSVSDNWMSNPAMQSLTNNSHFFLSFSKSSDLQLSFNFCNSDRRCCLRSVGGNVESTKLPSQDLVALLSFSSLSSSSLFSDVSVDGGLSSWISNRIK